MERIIVNVSKDFGLYPGLRTYDISGVMSGEVFYHKILNARFYEALGKGMHLVVVLDGTMGYTPSFIDETFGRLVYDFGADKICATLEIVSKEEPVWKNEVEKKTIPMWEERRKRGQFPVNTPGYDVPAWWHMNQDGSFIQMTKYDGNK